LDTLTSGTCALRKKTCTCTRPREITLESRQSAVCHPQGLRTQDSTRLGEQDPRNKTDDERESVHAQSLQATSKAPSSEWLASPCPKRPGVRYRKSPSPSRRPSRPAARVNVTTPLRAFHPSVDDVFAPALPTRNREPAYARPSPHVRVQPFVRAPACRPFPAQPRLLPRLSPS
jgi:hypothetical protein